MSFLSQFGPHLCRFCPNRFLVFMSSVSPIQRPPSCELSKCRFLSKFPLCDFSQPVFSASGPSENAFFMSEMSPNHVGNVLLPCRKRPKSMSHLSQPYVGDVLIICRKRPRRMSEMSPTNVSDVPLQTEQAAKKRMTPPFFLRALPS
jgi:hypothetical protein